MNRSIRNFLIELARIKSTVSYGILNDQLQLGYNFKNDHDRKLIGEDLGEISKYEHNNGRPLLSVLVTRKGTDEEGDGFYKLCEELGYGDSETLKHSKTFDEQQKNECYSFWRDNDNYKKFK